MLPVTGRCWLPTSGDGTTRSACSRGFRWRTWSETMADHRPRPEMTGEGERCMSVALIPGNFLRSSLTCARRANIRDRPATIVHADLLIACAQFSAVTLVGGNEMPEP